MSDQRFDEQKLYAAQIFNQQLDQRACQDNLIRGFWEYMALPPVDRVWRSREICMDERNRERLESYRVKRRVLGV